METDTSFDLVRLTKSKRTVDLSPNTIREYSRSGLALYHKGRAVFFSRSELDAFIRSTAQVKGRTLPNGGTATVRGHGGVS